MRIERAEVIVTSPGRNFVTLKLTTDEGLTGLGDATLNGREQAVVAYLAEHVVPLLLGLDATRIEHMWQFLYRSAYWRRGPVTMAAIAAVDVALWDIKGKAAGMPVYQLLGGASRTGLLAYAHASGEDLPQLFDSVRAQIERGFRAVRVQASVPGLGTSYGVTSRDANGDVATGRSTSAVEVEEWSAQPYLAYLPQVFEAVRNEFGPELDLLHDVHHRLTPIQAARLGKDLEPYRLFWLEDCTPAENQEALRWVRQHTTTPLAIGEIFNTAWDFKDLISEQLIDYARGTVTHMGGISALRKSLDYAALYQIKSGMHGPADISPVGLSASMHLGLAIHNFGIQEYMGHPDHTAEVFEQSFRFEAGMLHPGDAPGLGVELDLDEAGKYPYERAYLPFCQLRDGTIHDW